MLTFRHFIFENKKTYAGNCINSFDENGECFGQVPYRDVTDFAQAEEKSKKISKEQFEKTATIPEHLKKITKSKDTIYLHDKDNNVHMMYDADKDVHHFFT
jgi:hypothetical protein